MALMSATLKTKIATEPVIEVRELCNRFGDHIVHENLELDLLRGEILGVVGGSGTGKTVLLRSIVGLIAPTSLNLQENIAVPLIEHAGLKRPEAEKLAGMKLALTGLPPEAAVKYPSELSGGMVKRASLARALALDPEILFLDEPTAGLDPIGAAGFDRLIVTLRDALGLTVFLVTHDLDTLYSTCDRVAVLSQRRVLVADTLETVATMEDTWIQDYFNGPRGRAASYAFRDHSQIRNQE